MSDAQAGNEPTAEEASGLRTQLGELGGANKLMAKQLEFVKHFPGVDPTSKPVVAMLTGFDGEMSKEALVAEAAAWNIVTPSPAAAPAAALTPAAVPEPVVPIPAAAGVTQAERDAAAAAPAGSGAPPVTDLDQNPYDVAHQRFETALKGGQEREEAAAEWIDEVFGRAANGDKRVLVPGGRQGTD